MTPRVSVVIPVHNGARFVRRALDSVLGQTIQDLEVVTVDDGSTDGTAEIITSVQDPRVHLVSQSNSGLASARNRGAQEADSEVLAFLDADDEWLPDKLARQLPSVRRGVVVYSDVTFWDEPTGRDIGTYKVFDRWPKDLEKFSGDLLEPLLAQNIVHPSTVVMTRADFEAAGRFDTTLRMVEDWDLWLRCAETMSFLRIEEPLARIRRRPDSLGADASGIRTAGTKVLSAARARLVESGRFDDKLKVATGLGEFAIRDMSAARRTLFGSVARRPWDLSRWRWAMSALLWPLIRRSR